MNSSEIQTHFASFSSCRASAPGVRTAQLFSTYFPMILALVLLMSLAVRILALVSWQESLYADVLMGDERIYHQWASALATGNPNAPAVHDFTPVYAHVMAFVYRCFGADPLYVRILNILFGTATCVLVYLIGDHLAGRTVGFFSCLAAGLYKPFIFFSVVLMKTAFSLFLFAAVFLLLIAALRKATAVNMLLLGCAAGLLLGVRANCILMIPVMPAVILNDLWKKHVPKKRAAAVMAAYGAGVMIFVLPAAAGHYQKTGEIALTAPGGFNIYLGNHPDHPGPYYRPAPFASSATAHQATQFVIEASRRSKETLSLAEASRYWVLEAIRLSCGNPLQFLEKAISKTLAVFNGFEAADNYHIGFVSDSVRFFRWPFLEAWMLLPLGMAWMALAMKTPEIPAGLFVVLASYAVTLVIVFTNVRIRLPLMIILMPFAVMGVRFACRIIASKSIKGAGVYAAVLALFSGIAVLPITGAGDLTAHYNTHGSTLYSKGRTAEALAYWQASSGMRGAYSCFADLSMADHHFRRGECAQALALLDRIPAGSIAGAQKNAKMGDVFIKMKQVSRAIRAYEASIAINSGQRDVIAKLAAIYRRIDPSAADRYREKGAYIASFYRTDGVAPPAPHASGESI